MLLKPKSLPGYEFERTWQMSVAKNTELTVLPYIGKEYSVSFELFINKFGRNAYESVIHLTTGANFAGMGSRNPAVWVMNSKHLTIASSISGNKNLHKNIPGLEKNKWYKIEITQKLVDGKVLNKDFEFKFISNILVHV